MDPEGTILFTTVELPFFGFDVFSLPLPSSSFHLSATPPPERRHTDGVSANFNAQFAGAGARAVAFVSERSGSARLYRSDSPDEPPSALPTFPSSLFLDRPTLRKDKLFFVSAHQPPSGPYRSWAAVYSAQLDRGDVEEPVRLTPPDVADLSPAVSPTGDLVAVASYGSEPWGGDFRELATSIVVFRVSDSSTRVVVSSRGGWPAWAGESTLFFHRKAEDGWWSIFRLNLTAELENAGGLDSARRVTPSGLHAFTPAASHDGKWIAVATRRKGRTHRHIEIFDLESENFYPITELINPNLHHYNPFVSLDSAYLGYHRFRGESAKGDSVVPNLQPRTSPMKSIRMLMVNGTFPSISPNGDLIAGNGDFLSSPGLIVIRSDGSNRWVLLKDPSAFYTVWSPTEKGVLYTSLGPIFESHRATVHIARISFDPDELADDREEITAPKVKMLTRPATGNDAFPSCSPDGRFIVFRSGRSGYKNLYIVDAVHGEPEAATGGGAGELRRLTEGEWIDTMPCWSPDGELIVFSSNRHNPANEAAYSIYLIRPDGTGLRRVYVAGPAGSADADRERINHVGFSPDSKWLVITANMGAVSAEPVSMPNQFQPYGDLYICRVDGSGLERLTFNPYENGTPVWGPPPLGLGLSSLFLGPPKGVKLRGQFDEPLWITCDI